MVTYSLILLKDLFNHDSFVLCYLSRATDGEVITKTWFLNANCTLPSSSTVSCDFAGDPITDLTLHEY